MDFFRDIVMVAATTPAASAAPADLWPLTNMGAVANWTIGSDCSFLTGPPTGIAFNEPVENTANSLTGAAETSFNAAVASSAAFNVTVISAAADHPDITPLIGTVFVAMKDGTPVAFVFAGTPSQEVTHTVTSGAGSGFDLIAGDDFPSGGLVDVEIYA